MERDTCDLTFFGEERIKDQGMLDDLDALVILHCSEESARDFKAGGISASMQDSIAEVSAFTGQSDLSGRRLIEDSATSDEASNCLWTFTDQDLNRARIAKAGSCGQSVLFMGLR